MGKLRTAIVELSNQLANLPQELDELGKFGKYSDRVFDLSQKCAQGYDAIYMYLIEKFKSQGSTVKAESGQKLKDIMDSEIKTYVKGIVQWKGDIKKLIASLNQEQSKCVDGFVTKITNAEAKAAELTRIAMKKKQAWFKSKEYKQKQKGYLEALGTISATLVEIKKSAEKLRKINQTDAWVEKNYPISTDMTVADIKNLSTMDLSNTLTSYKNNKAAQDNHVKTFRDSWKTIPGQLATIRKWVQDADNMEKVEG